MTLKHYVEERRSVAYSDRTETAGSYELFIELYKCKTAIWLPRQIELQAISP